MASAVGLGLSLFSTACLDSLRDRVCCPGGRALKPGDVLATNGATLVSSWLYALFYGRLYACAASLLAPRLVAQPMAWFLAVSFLQRFMCAVLMRDVHRKTGPLLHFFYYGCYFLGARGPHGRGEYAVLAAASVASSLVSAHATGAATRVSWRVHYRNGVATELADGDAYWARFHHVLFWQQPEAKLVYCHARGGAIAAILWQLYHSSFLSSSSSSSLFF